jgi:Zn-dependent protease with chaperone function
MSRRVVLGMLAGGVILLGCTSWTVHRIHSAGLAAELVLATAALLWVARCALLLTSSRRALAALPRQDPPEALRLAADRTGLSRVTFLSSCSPIAFCTGFLRPTVCVSAGLLSRIEPSELDAVLVHERHHVERRDPLRRTLMWALRDVFFFLPLVDWWIAGRVFESELAADRRALGEVGLQPLASALLVAGDLAALPAVAGFMGATALRTAQLIGAPMPERRATRRAIVLSAVGLVAVAAVSMCAFTALL